VLNSNDATESLIQQARDVIDQGSKSFAAASRLFGPELRADVMLLYCWCRHCDDLTDGQELGRGTISTATRESLDNLREQSLAALSGNPNNELPFRALADIARRHPINRALIEAHIRGFELDVSGWHPETIDDTVRYCYHTAGTVGVIMAKMMGVHDAATLHRASDLGIAFQLINIARDVLEDAQAGRSYLPAAWRKAAGLDTADLLDSNNHERAYPLVLRLIDEAEPYYQSASIGIHALPRRAAWAIASAREIYRDIGRQIVRSGPRALSGRIYTSKAHKLWRIATSAPAALSPRHTHLVVSRVGLWTPPEIV